MRRVLLLSIVISVPVFSQQPSSSEALEPLAPKMRAVDRDWNYFKQIRCEDVERIVFHSRAEELLLAKRKAQCLEKYEAFLPVPVDR